MMHEYEKLLEELGISLDDSSYEISTQLKQSINEYRNMMTSWKTKEENDEIYQKVNLIIEAERYYSNLAECEEIEDEEDDFDYSSLKVTVQSNSNRKDIKEGAASDENSDLQDEGNELTFEERYHNITEYMYGGDFSCFKKGFKQLEQLAKDGYVEAQIEAGEICRIGGDGTTCSSDLLDLDKAIYWYKKAANQGDARSCYVLGAIYDNENYCSKEVKDDVKAFYWYKKAAEAGVTDAYNKLGACYELGIGTDKDIIEAIKWYEKAAEAITEFDEAFFGEDFFGKGSKLYRKLGIIYRDEDEVKDIDKAIYWLNKAIESRDKIACDELEKLLQANQLIDWQNNKSAR